MNGYATARQNGWMSANDIRELENLDRIPAEEGGDLYLINGNMLPLKNAGAFAETSIDIIITIVVKYLYNYNKHNIIERLFRYAKEKLSENQNA